VGPSSSLNPAQRGAALERMRSEAFDVLVIGGGVTGTGTALDAATRGLSVALIEQRDYAAGTSSRSSKLIHGGLRYLEQLNLGLVREALKERTLLLTRLAPHLVRPVPFLYPLTHRAWERVYVGAGVALYDLMAGAGEAGRSLPRHRHLSKRNALRTAPALREDALTGAIQYYDAQVDDARHTLALARSAAQYGAALATSVRAAGLVREGERVVGARARDLESGEELEIRAQQVINATGVWTDDIQQLAGRGRLRVRASKGIHLVVPRDRIHADAGIISRAGRSVLFVVPWPAVPDQRHWIVGTTDTEWDLDKAHPAASRADIDYLLEQANRVLRPALTHADVEGVYAGLRPLLYGESEATSRLSREHAVSQSVAGLISVAGGKYTTYRVMAADAQGAGMRIGILTGGATSPASTPASRRWSTACGRRTRGRRHPPRGGPGCSSASPDDPESVAACTMPLDPQAGAHDRPHGGTILHTSRTNPGGPRPRCPSSCATTRSPEGVSADFTEPHVLRCSRRSASTRSSPSGVTTPCPTPADARGGCAGHRHPEDDGQRRPRHGLLHRVLDRVTRSVNFINNLRTSAGSHERLAVIELFGRYSGETSLISAYLAGVDRAIISEVPFDIDRLASSSMADKRNNPSGYAMVTSPRARPHRRRDHAEGGGGRLRAPQARWHRRAHGASCSRSAPARASSPRPWATSCARAAPTPSTSWSRRTTRSWPPTSRWRAPGPMVALRTGRTPTSRSRHRRGRARVDVDALYDATPTSRRSATSSGKPMFLALP
jgi:glycerol-3-phosphate dehydrogenase